MKIVLLFLFPGLLYSQARVPMKHPKTAKEILCDYKNELAKPDFNIKLMIPLFENLYNTNSIEDLETKQKIYCVLLNYYQKNDKDYANEFKADMKNVDCEKTKI